MSAAGRDQLTPDAVPAALFFFESGQLCGLNEAARELLGFNRRTAMATIVAALDPQQLLAERLRTLSNDAADVPLRIDSRRRDGETLCLELHADLDPATGVVVVLAHDCSQWQDMEEQLQRRLVFGRLITEASAALIRSDNDILDSVIVDVLGSVGGFFGIDRAYVFLFDEVAATQSNTHEWVAPGISKEAHNLQDVPLTTFPWLLAQLRADQVFQVARIAEMPAEAVNEYTEFEREGIQSILIVPLRHGPDLRGFVGFDSVRQQIDWGDHYVLGLRLMAQMLTSALDARVLSLRLHALAYHDPLTGLPNRKLLEDRCLQALQRLQRDGGSVVLAVVDVDDFKRINDSYGHPVGDLLLCELARRLREAIRGIDTVARMGGDEFVVLAKGGDKSGFAELAQRLLDTCAEPMVLDERSMQIGLSIGMVEAWNSHCSLDGLLRSADAAMYQAKTQGKNRWVGASGVSPSVD